MATTYEFVFGPEDEKSFFEFLSKWDLTLYPEYIPQNWKAPKVEPGCLDAYPEMEACYIAAEGMAPIQMRSVKRGKKAGHIEINESESPVIHYVRSMRTEDGVLLSGRLWMWLDIVGDIQRNPAFPEHFRRLWLNIRDYLTRTGTKSNPAGWSLGPQAVRLHKQGTVLRSEGHKGKILKPYIVK